MPFTLIGAREVILLISKYVKEKYLKLGLAISFTILVFAQVNNGLNRVLSHKYDYEKDCGIWLKNYVNKSQLHSKLKLKTPVLYAGIPALGYWSKLNFEPFGLPSNNEGKSAFKKYLEENVDYIVLDKKDKKANDFVASIGSFREVGNPYKKYLNIYSAITP